MQNNSKKLTQKEIIEKFREMWTEDGMIISEKKSICGHTIIGYIIEIFRE